MTRPEAQEWRLRACATGGGTDAGSCPDTEDERSVVLKWMAFSFANDVHSPTSLTKFAPNKKCRIRGSVS